MPLDNDHGRVNPKPHAGVLGSSRDLIGNPVRIRGCPAAVSENDIHNDALVACVSRGLGSGG